MNNHTLVLAALSGGVDSSIVLHILKDKFKKLYGISHSHWPESKCCTTVCIDNCRFMCNSLSIPYYVLDTVVFFDKNIVAPFVTDYTQGFTPNPCVLCNQLHRFKYVIDAFFKKSDLPVTSDLKIATGHYARTETINGIVRLKKGKDPSKDQSYMLYRLDQNQLKLCLFPLGNFLKSEIRSLACNLELPNARQKDSQDICFVQDDYRDFLSQYTGVKGSSGFFLDQDGNTLGKHNGISAYTRGQRKGLGLSGGPWYVIDINSGTNTVILGRRKALEVSQFIITNCQWQQIPILNGSQYSVQVRYHGNEYKCTITESDNKNFIVNTISPVFELAYGQSAVIYDDDLLIGGGIITKPPSF